ncbi:MAG: metal-dependent hydrolase [Bacteroidetes bacterium]|nr:metal-dependent hydrolase [Bacteroidota bacterium]
MKFTYYGHSTFGMRIGGKDILFDPFISGNELASDVNIAEIPADYILLTHGHGDHVADVEAIAKRTGARIVSNFEIATHFGNKGFENHPINQGGHWKFDFGTVKYVNAIHSSSFPDGSYAGNPGGFVVWNDDVCFYHAGDTALTMDMKLIPMLCPKLDFAILPIGDNFTMNAKEAALASTFIECDTIIGCHYDTFGYIKIDHDEAHKVFESKGKKLILPAIGLETEV